MVLEGLPLFFIIIVREEEALVDLWAGCHVFRQPWIIQGSILWSRWKEKVCKMEKARLRH